MLGPLWSSLPSRSTTSPSTKMSEGQTNQEGQGKSYLDLQWSQLTIVEKYIAIAYIRYLRAREGK